MNEKINDIIGLIKENDIFKIDLWIKIAIVILYSDSFLGYMAMEFNIKIEHFSDILNGRFILLFVLFTIGFILLLKICISVLFFISFNVIAPLIIKYIYPKSNENITYSRISAETLKRFALLNNNTVAERLYQKIEKAERDQFYDANLIIGMAILLSIDAFFGVYMAQIIGNGSLRIAVLLVSIVIIIHQSVVYHNIEYGIYISKDVIDEIDKIDKGKSYIEEP